ncbi:MAG: Hpt domain-containing protein [Hydrogenophaga sp.]
MRDSITDSLPPDAPLADLGPLAWVFDEVRKSLDGAGKATKRFLREATQKSADDLDGPDPTPLRSARQQLHQAVGALEMVGLEQPAQLLRGMEAAVQRFVQRPQTCDAAAVQQVEQAGFALLEFLQGLLNSKSLQPLVLFPQYRNVQTLAGVDRIHPADLWSFDRHATNMDAPLGVKPLLPNETLRSMFERSVLLVVKTNSAAAANSLTRLCAGLSAGAESARVRTFWHVAAAYFEGTGASSLPVDVYAKRSASRILMQFNTLKPKVVQNSGPSATAVSETLLRDLLFFCAFAKCADPGYKSTPYVAAVRRAFGLESTPWVDYTRPSLGQFDPALLAQARKRVHAAKDAWGLFTSGDVNRGRQVADQYGLVGDSLTQLHPASAGLAQGLKKAVEHALKDSKVSVRPELAMEVATTTLYLEAAFDDFDPGDVTFGERCNQLNGRLQKVIDGEFASPLEAWMEQLYRRVSDRQTMGSVVGELKVSLAEIEKTLDQFFRFPREKAGLVLATSQLAQMRGVLSVLGLEQAVKTVNRMRTTVEHILDADSDADPALNTTRFQQLGNNLSALSFLVDMLNYQPGLAKQLFFFDEEAGELKPLMGRLPAPMSVADSEFETFEAAALVDATTDASATTVTVTDPTPVSAADLDIPMVASAVVADEDDDELDLREIFLEEAREVVVNGHAAVRDLQARPDELDPLTTLRRAFHTLKGSSRMVGLDRYGEAAWAVEQLFNAVLAEQRPVTHGLLSLAHQTLGAFDRWADSIESESDLLWHAQPFIASALAMREQSVLQPLDVPGSESFPPLAETLGSAEPEAESEPSRSERPNPQLAHSPADVEAEQGEGEDEAPQKDEHPADFASTAPADLDAVFGSGADAQAKESPKHLLEGVDFDDLSRPTESPPVDSDMGSGALPSMFDGLSLEFDDLPELVVDEATSELAAQESSSVLEAPLPALDALALPEADTVDGDHSDTGSASDLRAQVETSDPLPEQPAQADEQPLEEWQEDPSLSLGDLGDPNGSANELPDEQMRLIGPLRIDLKLYNVYLNEADEWSRRLGTALSEWLLEYHEPLPTLAESLAHSLAGSSAAVGFQPMSEISRALEHALGAMASHQRAGQSAKPEQAQLFAQAAEEIRRLLHQFAAGFYKEPVPELLQALQGLPNTLPAFMGSGSGSLDADSLPDWESSERDPLSDDPVPLVSDAPEALVSAFAPPDFEVSALGDLPAPMAPLLPRVATSGSAQDIDDDIDALDGIDADLFPIFSDEALELLPRLGSALRQWVSRPENASARGEVLRNLHTLKGSARLAGALRLGEMAHRLETDAERIDMDRLTDHALAPLLVAYDAILARFDVLRAMDPDAQGVVQTAAETVSDQADLLSMKAAASEALEGIPALDVPPALESVAGATGLTGLSLPPVPRPVVSRAGAAVRVRPELLDRLVTQTGEVITTRSRMDGDVLTLRSSLKELTGNLERLRLQLHEMEIQAETQMQARLAQARDADQTFDPLELDRFTRVQEITRMMAESVNDVATVQRTLQRAVESTEDGLAAMGRQTRELQRDLLRTRMVEFEGISERLYRVVRQASKETGKQVRLDISGGHIEMDRGVLDRMTAAFEHVLRNCVVHGLELPEARLKAGKSAEGRINIQLGQELNDVSVVFQDDGAGLDLTRLRERAKAMGLLAKGQSLSDAQTAELVFQPGLSTASEVSSLAGRGVGMDVVRNDVMALGGRVETSTQSGQCTAFKLVLPLTTAVTQVVMLRAGNFTVGVPSVVVERVRRVTPAELDAAYAKNTLLVGDEEVPFYWAGALLQTSAKSAQARERTLPVVVFRSAAQRVAMHVDEVLGNQKVVVKNLGSQLSRLPGLAGMSVLNSGAVALIYNTVALAKVYGDQVRGWLGAQAELTTSLQGQAGDNAAASAAKPNAVPLILVVDDSITVRRVTQRLLQREGYRVSLAADGLQALERLQQERPALVLSDIEMPRMDGFDLVRNMRNDQRLTDLPVIMITSRIADKHREHARALGVDHYLGKPYSEEELLGLIARYTQVAAAQ